MAVFTVNAAEVKPVGAVVKWGVAGEAIAAGQSTRKGADGLIYLAQADGTQAEADGNGIAVNTAPLIGQPIAYCDSGDVQIDTASVAEAAVGDLVVLGATAGGLYPEGDLGSGDFVTVLGVVKQNSSGCIVTLNPWATRVEKP